MQQRRVRPMATPTFGRRQRRARRSRRRRPSITGPCCARIVPENLCVRRQARVHLSIPRPFGFTRACDVRTGPRSSRHACDPLCRAVPACRLRRRAENRHHQIARHAAIRPQPQTRNPTPHASADHSPATVANARTRRSRLPPTITLSALDTGQPTFHPEFSTTCDEQAT